MFSVARAPSAQNLCSSVQKTFTYASAMSGLTIPNYVWLAKAGV